MTEVLAALLPTIGVSVLFWFAIRAILQADRREREEAALHATVEAPAPGPATEGPADISGDPRPEN